MKIIVRMETKLCSGTTTSLYIPGEGVEFATDESYYGTLEKLYEDDLEFFGNQVEDKEIWTDDLTAHIYAGDYSISYETIEVKTI